MKNYPDQPIEGAFFVWRTSKTSIFHLTLLCPDETIKRAFLVCTSNNIMFWQTIKKCIFLIFYVKKTTLWYLDEPVKRAFFCSPDLTWHKCRRRQGCPHEQHWQKCESGRLAKKTITQWLLTVRL